MPVKTCICAISIALTLLACSTSDVSESNSTSVEAPAVPAPHYPQFPYCFDAKGSVTLSYQVNAEGDVEEISVVSSSDERFNRSAVRSLKAEEREFQKLDLGGTHHRTYLFEPPATCERPQ